MENNVVSAGKSADWTPDSENNHLFTGQLNNALYSNSDAPGFKSHPPNWQQFIRFRFKINMLLKFISQHGE